MSLIPIEFRRNIPRKIRRAPILRTINALQYSKLTDMERQLERLKAVFPDNRLTGEKVLYEKTYVLAMSARVGSTALVEWLKVSGLSNFKIREIFNNHGMAANFAEQWNAKSLCQYLNSYAELSGEKRLPFKVTWWDMAALLRMIDGDLDTWFPRARWVYLERHDKVAQAYSLWKIFNHGGIHIRKGQDYSSPVTGNIPLDSIRERIQLIELENEQWKRFFDENKISPLCIFYEDFLESPREVMASAFHAFTGSSLDEDTDCPIIRSSDDRDIANIETLKKQL